MLLQRLGIEFKCESPDIDESGHLDETPAHLVQRLAEAKSGHIATSQKDALIIGSDQVATHKRNILSKPGNHENALLQLKALSGQKITFFTGLCVTNAKTGKSQTDCIENIVYFRKLTHQEIENYLLKEQPYDCAGSFKSEALGISLVREIEGTDPTALIGLPLIRLCEMLRNEGIELP